MASSPAVRSDAPFSPRTPPAERLRVFDVARGLAVVFVVFFHLNFGIANTPALDLPAAAREINDALHLFRIPFLFFMAGLFAQRLLDQGWAHLWRRRLATLVWLYLSWTAIIFTARLVLGGHANHPAEATDLLAAPVYPVVDHLWFLYALGLSHLTLRALATRVPLAWIVAGALAASVGIPIFDNTNFSGYLHNFVYYAAGVAAAGRLAGGLRRVDGRHLVALSLALLAALASVNAAGWDAHRVAAVALAALGIAWATALAAVLDRRVVADWLALAGRYSHVIYVAHPLFYVAARLLLLKGLGVTGYLPHLVFGWLAGTVGPLVMLAVAERLGWAWVFGAPRWLVELRPRAANVPAASGHAESRRTSPPRR